MLSFGLCCGCRINHTVILEDPFDDPAGLSVPDRSPEPTKEQLDVSVFIQCIIKLTILQYCEEADFND